MADTGVVIQTPRLRLRRFVAADAPAVAAMHREARLRAYLVDDHPLDEPAEAAEFVRRLAWLYAACPGLGIWHAEQAVATPATPAPPTARGGFESATTADWCFSGWFSLMPMPGAVPGRVEIGCRLLPQAWGTGLVMDGGEALLHHAFGPLGLDEVWGVCHPQHRSVHMVLRALGFASLGPRDYTGQPASHYRIDREAWRRMQAQPRRERLRRAVRRPSCADVPPSTVPAPRQGGGLRLDTSTPGSIPAC